MWLASCGLAHPADPLLAFQEVLGCYVCQWLPVSHTAACNDMLHRPALGTGTIPALLAQNICQVQPGNGDQHTTQFQQQQTLWLCSCYPEQLLAAVALLFYALSHRLTARAQVTHEAAALTPGCCKPAGKSCRKYFDCTYLLQVAKLATSPCRKASTHFTAASAAAWLSACRSSTCDVQVASRVRHHMHVATSSGLDMLAHTAARLAGMGFWG